MLFVRLTLKIPTILPMLCTCICGIVHKLPILRDEIYSYILLCDKPLVYASGDVVRQIRFLQETSRCNKMSLDYLDKIFETRMLQVNRQIYEEAQENFLKEMPFSSPIPQYGRVCLTELPISLSICPT